MHREAFKKLFLAKLLSDISNYFRVYEFLKVKAKSLKNGAILIEDEEDFWKKVLGDRFLNETDGETLNNGTVLKFENMFLTDWAPKLPGGIWTKKGNSRAFGFREELDLLQVGERMHPIIHPDAKSRRINSGFGSIRVNPIGNDSDYFNYMNLVSPKYWNTDFGIPVIVPKSVYQEFIAKSKRGAPWVEKLEGILILNEQLPVSNFISNSIGHKLSDEIENELTNMPHLPKCYLYIPSRLNIEIKTNDTHPVTTAWTMFETRRNDYGLTYCHFNPFEKDAFEGVSDFLEEYSKRFDGTKIVTDYDGITPRLNAKVNLKVDPMEKNKQDLEEIVQKVDRKE